MLGYAKTSNKTSWDGSGVQDKSSICYVLKSIKCFKSHSTWQNVIFQSYCNLCIKNSSHRLRGSCIWTVNFRRLQEMEYHCIKGALASLTQILETQSPLKMMKNAFFFTFKALLLFMIFKILNCCFECLVIKTTWLKDKANFNFYDVTAWLTNNYNTHIDQYLKK